MKNVGSLLFRPLLSFVASVTGVACAANKVSLSCAATYASKESKCNPKAKPTEGSLDRLSGYGNVVVWQDANTVLPVFGFTCKASQPAVLGALIFGFGLQLGCNPRFVAMGANSN